MHEHNRTNFLPHTLLSPHTYKWRHKLCAENAKIVNPHKITDSNMSLSTYLSDLLTERGLKPTQVSIVVDGYRTSRAFITPSRDQDHTKGTVSEWNLSVPMHRHRSIPSRHSITIPSSFDRLSVSDDPKAGE